MSSEEYHIQRMISTIREKGFHHQRILDAMRKTPRHHFVPKGTSIIEAYDDRPVPLGEEQTISQPSTVAFMLDLLDLRAGLHVLEVGTGTGWNAALIKHLIGGKGSITTLECIPHLAKTAELILAKCNLEVNVVQGDGSKGYPPKAPYDRIIVTCAAPFIYSAWTEQLKPAGIIVAPIGAYHQEMIKAIKHEEDFSVQRHGLFRFVPMRVM
jgi:protein-L-isoaspartate(D-aspartate) O-methyltransferase